jgi:hypothetical protein
LVGGKKEVILLVFYTVLGDGYKKEGKQKRMACEGGLQVSQMIFNVMKDRQWILPNDCLYWSGCSHREHGDYAAMPELARLPSYP